MSSPSPFSFPKPLGGSSRGPRRGPDLPLGRLLAIGAVVAVLLLLWVIGATGSTEGAEADEESVTDLEAVVGPALTRAGYGDVIVETDGRTVTLSGELATRADVVAAGAVANSIADVAFVINNLSFPGQAFTDDIPDGIENPGDGDDGGANPFGGTTTDALVLQSRISQAAALNPITFASGGVELTPESAGTVTAIATILTENTGARVEIGGHTDSDGVPEENEALSQARADAVLNALVAAGVPADQLESVGYGDSMPIASNETGEGKALNRRIEFLLLV